MAFKIGCIFDVFGGYSVQICCLRPKFRDGTYKDPKIWQENHTSKRIFVYIATSITLFPKLSYQNEKSRIIFYNLIYLRFLLRWVVWVSTQVKKLLIRSVPKNAYVKQPSEAKKIYRLAYIVKKPYENLVGSAGIRSPGLDEYATICATQPVSTVSVLIAA